MPSSTGTPSLPYPLSVIEQLLARLALLEGAGNVLTGHSPPPAGTIELADHAAARLRYGQWVIDLPESPDKAQPDLAFLKFLQHFTPDSSVALQAIRVRHLEIAKEYSWPIAAALLRQPSVDIRDTAAVMTWVVAYRAAHPPAVGAARPKNARGKGNAKKPRRTRGTTSDHPHPPTQGGKGGRGGGR